MTKTYKILLDKEYTPIISYENTESIDVGNYLHLGVIVKRTGNNEDQLTINLSYSNDEIHWSNNNIQPYIENNDSVYIGLNNNSAKFFRILYQSTANDNSKMQVSINGVKRKAGY